MGLRQSHTYTSLPEDWPWIWGIRDPQYLDWKCGLSDEEIQVQAKRHTKLPVAITENVYLGNAFSVESIDKLQSLGITAVLNVAGSRAVRPKTIEAFKRHNIKYKMIEGEDEPDYELLRKDWKTALAFIEASTMNGKGKCVVHCAAGINRSSLVVAAYYMLATKTPVLETVKHVRKQRGNIALCNKGFQQQLVAMARVNDLLGAKPGTNSSIIQKAPPPPDQYPYFSIKERDNPLDRLAYG